MNNGAELQNSNTLYGFVFIGFNVGTINNKSSIFVKKRTTMGTIELKSELISLIEKTEDSKVLNAIYVLLTNLTKTEKKADFWDELPEALKKEIDEGIAEADRGETIPHKEAMKQIRAKIASL